MSAPLPANETKRLAALRRYAILDTPPEQAFDDFTLLASTLCHTPIALMTLVDEDRQWFKARHGLDRTETPREQSFCAYAILKGEVMIVEDTARDARFADHPLVISAPKIRFYAGAPLIDSEGHALGTLCVIDQQPRQLAEEQRVALEAMARLMVGQMEMRRSSHELAVALGEIKTLQGLLPICSHCGRILNDAGAWQGMESYVRAHSDAEFSHSICPACVQLHHPALHARRQAQGRS